MRHAGAKGLEEEKHYFAGGAKLLGQAQNIL